MFKKSLNTLTRSAAIAAVLVASMSQVNAAFAEEPICYNCPPQWADWASQLKSIEETLGYKLPHDNKNSGQTLSQLLTEKDNPVADVAYYGVSFGITAAKKVSQRPTSLNIGMKYLKDLRIQMVTGLRFTQVRLAFS